MKRMISCLAILSVALLSDQASASQNVKNRLRQVGPKGLDTYPIHERSEKAEYKVPEKKNNKAQEIPDSNEKKRAQMFEKLSHTFAQDAPNEEQAYLELAKKLMKLTDVLGDL